MVHSTKSTQKPIYYYDALGNTYWVLLDEEAPAAEVIVRLCQTFPSDGLLVGSLKGDAAAVRIFNPDGSEAQKSGNGVRLFAQALKDHGEFKGDALEVLTLGGTTHIRWEHGDVAANLGSVQAPIVKIKLTTLLSQETIDHYNLKQGFIVNVGNPHVVIHCEGDGGTLATVLGEQLENHEYFQPERTNVQFLKVIDRKSIRIGIWERGAGYTQSSGTSSTACAATILEGNSEISEISVQMAGGVLRVRRLEDGGYEILGPVRYIEQQENFFK